MKKLILSAIALTVAGLASAQTATQTNGKVIFNGEVVDQTCVVKAGSETQTVKLPTVGQNAFTNGATNIGRTTFTISVAQCNGKTSGGGQKIRANFISSPNVDQATFALKNTHIATQTEPKAQNVQLRLHELGGAHIKLGQTNYTVASGDHLDVSGKREGEIQYHVEYIKAGTEGNGDVTVGKVKSEVEYSLVYE